jgi:hypothetical protein
MTLDRDTLAELVELLTPLMRGEQQRRALLAKALTGSPILDSIDYGGPADAFTTRVIWQLMSFGEAEPGVPALWALLETCCKHVGIDKQLRIDALRNVITSAKKVAGVQQAAVDRLALHEVLVSRFSIHDYELLCLDVQQSLAYDGISAQINLDMVGGDASKPIKALQLIEYLEKRDFLVYLIAAVRRHRPGAL